MVRLLRRQSLWLPTFQGWFLIGVILVVILGTIATQIRPFLAPTQRIATAEALVIEGWVSDQTVGEVVKEFQSHPYQAIITTGGPLVAGFYLSEYKTYAEVSAATLRKIGIPPSKVIAVSADPVRKDRTYAAAIALKHWFTTASFKPKAVNVITGDVHARRTWVLFQSALAPDIAVGIVAASPTEYDPDRWWASSAGVRSVISEAIALVYGWMFRQLG